MKVSGDDIRGRKRKNVDREGEKCGPHELSRGSRINDPLFSQDQPLAIVLCVFLSADRGEGKGIFFSNRQLGFCFLITSAGSLARLSLLDHAVFSMAGLEGCLGLKLRGYWV